MATASFSYQQNYNAADTVRLDQNPSLGRSVGPQLANRFVAADDFYGDGGAYFTDADREEEIFPGETIPRLLTADEYSAFLDFSDRSQSVILGGGNWGDILKGGSGDDILNGGDGDDTLVGGAGADSFDGEEGIDTVTYADARTGVLASLHSSIQPSGSDAAGDTYLNVENLTGSNYNDFLVGDEGANVLIGGLGNDILYAAPDDAVDRVNGGRGHDTLLGSTDDILIGGKGADKIYIAGAAHKVDGGTGFDQLFISTESLIFEAGDKITGIEKVVLEGTIMNVDFSAVVSSGLDITSQATDSAVILGTSGNDILRAGSHGDLLIAGTGNDTLIAGASTDVLRIGATHGRVEIRDFDITYDQFDFSETSARGMSDLTFTQFGGKTVISIAGETNAQRIVLTNTDASELMANVNISFAGE